MYLSGKEISLGIKVHGCLFGRLEYTYVQKEDLSIYLMF